MIDLTQNEPLFSLPEMIVISPSGSYEETDLIQCALAEDSGTPVAAYQAQFVKFGDAVYQQDIPLTFDQVEALKNDVPMEEVINNKDLIEARISHLDLIPGGEGSESVKPRIPTTSDEVGGTSPASNPDDPQVGDLVGEKNR